MSMSAVRSSASRYRDGARAIAPIGIAAVVFGISFGVLAAAAGIGWLPAVVMSATTFAGSAQFAAASVLDDGGSVASAIAAALLLNARYAALSVSVAPGFGGRVWRRLLEAQTIVDETWAVAARGRGRFDVPVMVGAGVVLYLAWVAGTLLGAIGGDVLGDPERLGLDAAFPALFLALLVPQLRDRRAVAAAVLGGLLALALIPWAPPGVPIIAGAAACLLGLRR
jgi:4-azaleucine resistance transporter AzlC